VRFVWIASYPKSGNTWVRFLLHHYLYGELRESSKLAARIPDIHVDPIPAAAPGRPVLAKTHWTLTPAMPHVNQTERAIYITRHPKDVAASLVSFYRLRDATSTWTDEQMIRLFIQSGGDPSMIKMGFGSWVENVTTWILQRRFPVLVVRYEDLRADSARELTRMIEFLGSEADPARISAAAAACTFDRMRALEVSEKSAQKAGHIFHGGKAEMGKGLMFMNKGRSGYSLDRIAPGLDKEFEARFKVPIWLLNYATETAQ
jgi:aryl sulfotransferase